MPKAKKRALSSSSESSESDAAEEEKAAEKPSKKNHAEKKVKTTATSSSDEQGKLKKMKKDKQEKPKEVPKEVQPVKEPEKKKTAEKEAEKVHKTTTVKDMLRAKRDRDSLRKMEQGKPTSSGATTATDNDDEDGESETASSIGVSESSHDSHPETAAAVNGVKDLTLPASLPTEVVAMISALKLYAETNPNVKTSFFDDDVLDQLVKIDNSAKTVGTSVRIQMFNYIEQFVPCTRKTLLAKVRKHRVVQQANKVKNEISKLKKIVTETMPGLVAKHEQDVSSYEELKRIQNVVGDSTPSSPPRKKYHWNDSSRLALSETVRYLQDQYKAAKLKNEDQEQFVARKLMDFVVPLWPEGWIGLEDFRKELDRKKKKENRALLAAAQSALPVHLKSNSAAVVSTNGKAPIHQQKTEAKEKSSELEVPIANGKASSPKSSVPSVSATSVIKRSSDHSIISIISASPSPPTTSQSLKVQDASKPRVMESDKLLSPTELLKATHSKLPLPRFSASPIDKLAPEKSILDKVRRSDSSDSSDCVEIVGEGEFNPIKPVKSSYHHNNNNKANHSGSQHPAPVAKKTRTHGSDDGEHETDYSKIIMGIQSLTVRKLFLLQFVASCFANPFLLSPFPTFF